MRVISTVFLLFVHLISVAQTNPENIRRHQYNTQSGWGLDAHDPVSYFSGNPLKGDKKISINYQGIYYAFANVANLNAFKLEPNKYEPQYGGWCAYAMGSNGEKVDVDPETYKIINGKLYLFYHSWTNNTLTKWNKDEQRLKISADKNWLKFFK
jgi:hypothetical protein